jgi:hypothetical protein
MIGEQQSFQEFLNRCFWEGHRVLMIREVGAAGGEGLTISVGTEHGTPVKWNVKGNVVRPLVDRDDDDDDFGGLGEDVPSPSDVTERSVA